LTNADFVAPPPEVEPNDAVRNEYLSALAAAREGKKTEAARAFRSFAQRYPSSRLASRALFLAALVESDPAAVSETVALLQRFFPRSEYLTELALRGVISSPESPAVTPTPTVSLDAATSSSAADQRLEMLREISRVRTEAEAAYRDKNYAEAIGTIENCAYAQSSPDLLDLLARCYIAQGDSRRAAEIIQNVLEKFTSYEGRSNLRLSYGLLLEDAGKYERAVAEYRLLIEEAPDSVEAQTARTRIQQLNQLTR
jgi:TolA-binding protein